MAIMRPQSVSDSIALVKTLSERRKCHKYFSSFLLNSNIILVMGYRTVFAFNYWTISLERQALLFSYYTLSFAQILSDYLLHNQYSITTLTVRALLRIYSILDNCILNDVEGSLELIQMAFIIRLIGRYSVTN